MTFKNFDSFQKALWARSDVLPSHDEKSTVVPARHAGATSKYVAMEKPVQVHLAPESVPILTGFKNKGLFDFRPCNRLMLSS